MDAFIGEIRPFAFDFPPTNWILCNGQTLSISQYTLLYTIIGFRFGGDGRTTFNLPNLQGSVVVGMGTSAAGITYTMGQQGGASQVALSSSQMASHSHTVNGLMTTDANSAPLKGVAVPDPNSYLSNLYELPPPSLKRQGYFYSPSLPAALLAPGSISPVGNGQPHNNMQPTLVISYCICAADGFYPIRP